MLCGTVCFCRQKQPLHEPFPEEISKRWFKGGEEVDKEIKSQFGALCKLSFAEKHSSYKLPSDLENQGNLSPQRHGCAVDAEPGTCLIDWEQQGTVGALARIIVLDQFTRNCFRDTARMYDFDSQALASAKKVVGAGMHKNLHHQVQGFIFMPYMHSEGGPDTPHLLT